MGMSIVLPTVSVIAAPATTLNGWVKNAQGVYNYYNNGTMVKNGWAKDSTGWCFLSAVDGSWVQQGWAKDSTGWGYIQNGYWVVGKAMYAKDSQGWNFIGTNGYVDSTVAVTATNPVDDATAAVVKAEGSKLAADVDVAKSLIAKINDAVSEKAALTTRVNAIVSTFEVSSVTVQDANHIKVAFTQAVDETTAEDTDNYDITGDTLTINKAELQSDGKTVILKLDASTLLSNDTDDDYTVKITDVKNAAGKVMPEFKQLISLYDNVKPTITNIAMKDRDQLQITLSEDIDGGSANPTNVKVYNEDGDKVTVSVNQDGDDNNIIDVTGLGDEDEGDYTVVVSNVKDLADNKVASTTEKFTLAEDTSDPKVSAVKAVSTSVLKVTFSEKIDKSTVDVDIDGTNVAIPSANISAVSGTDSKAYYITVPAQTKDASLKVKVYNFEDMAGNEGDSFSKYVKFSDEDAVALKDTNGTIETFDGTKYAVFTYDQDVNGLTNKVVPTDGSYVDEDGDSVDFDASDTTKINYYDSDTAPTAVDINDDQIAIELTDLDKGDYTVTLPDGFATVNGLDTDEVDVTFSISSDTTNADVHVSKIGTDYTGGVVALTSGTNDQTYYVQFDGEVNSTALNTSNYKLDGSTVFSKAVFVDSDKKIVKLTAEDGAIDTTTTLNNAVIAGPPIVPVHKLTVKNVEDSDGNDVNDFDSSSFGATYNTVVFEETVRPEIDDVAMATLNTIVVTFDEPITQYTGSNLVNGDDFAVEYKDEDGKTVTVDVDTATPSNGGRTWTLALADDIESTYQSIKAGTATFSGKDAAGNKAVADSMKSVDMDEDAPTFVATTGTWTKGSLTAVHADNAVLTFSEALSATGRTAVENAVKGAVSGAAGTDLVFTWAADNASVTIVNNNALTAATFAADASANIKDLAGNPATVTLDLK